MKSSHLDFDSFDAQGFQLLHNHIVIKHEPHCSIEENHQT